ncbi:MAG TPA: hypothetical protein VJ914_23825 [Pseudonocardiaceae bacterium]|nr:hypothetical protein [Pseudonocardiaceae bacterium]
MTGDGILTAGSPGNWWAWAGAHLAPAQPPATTEPIPPAPPAQASGQYISGTVHGPAVQARDIHGDIIYHLGKDHAAAPDLLPWLGALWQTGADTGAAVELRLLNHADRTLTAYFLCRATAPDQTAAIAFAAHLRDALAPALPGLTPTAIETQPRLSAVLEPFVPHQHGIVEIRKRLTVSRCLRNDTLLKFLAVVTPLAGGGTSWPDVWANLAAFPAPALLSVRLEPFRVGPGLRANLAAWAREFARLAVPGPPPNPTWPKPRAADPFAASTKKLYESAVDRYTERVFRIRMSLAASVPMSDDAAQLLANTISAPQAGVGFTGDAPVIVRPRTPEHAMTAWRNITALNADPIGPMAPECLPEESIGDVARALVTTADIHEAAAVFRPPYPVAGSPTVFTGDAASGVA